MQLEQQERSLLAALTDEHRLWPAGAEPVVLARGSENTTFAVGDCIVRLGADRDAVAREVALLRALGSRTAVAVPAPLVHRPELGLLVYRRVPGTPLISRQDRSSPSLVRGLVEVLGALRSVGAGLELPTDDYAAQEWHRDAVEAFGRVRSHLGAGEASLVAAFLDREPPPPRVGRVPQHNDLGAEHLLVDARGHLTGVIDWSDAARTDPARDLGSLYRDLGGATAHRVAEALGQPLTEDEAGRVRFHARCRWLEDVAYGLQDPAGRGVYLENARRTFAHTFGERG
ncbi:phosphotransferase family protein [Auraticoccus cholistanensis]|uniref:phosphotransferase family protein n=1 Tax=Auraticoccus cholistanensis TaxID=2656650 RepID=UPI0012E7B67C